MGYGIFKDKEEYDQWMNSYAEVQNQLNDLQYRVKLKQAELASEQAGELVSQFNDEDHKVMINKTLQTILHTVSLLDILIRGFGGGLK